MKKAFTLTELVVSIGILALVVGASIPAFRNIGKDRQLELIAEEVKDAIVLARTSVLAPDRSKDSTALGQFTFQIVDNNTYRVLDGRSAEMLRKDLPKDLIFSTSSLTIEFKFENQGQPNAPADFLIRSQSRGKSRTIKVSSTGTVTVTR